MRAGSKTSDGRSASRTPPASRCARRENCALAWRAGIFLPPAATTSAPASATPASAYCVTSARALSRRTCGSVWRGATGALLVQSCAYCTTPTASRTARSSSSGLTSRTSRRWLLRVRRRLGGRAAAAAAVGLARAPPPPCGLAVAAAVGVAVAAAPRRRRRCRPFRRRRRAAAARVRLLGARRDQRRRVRRSRCLDEACAIVETASPRAPNLAALAAVARECAAAAVAAAAGVAAAAAGRAVAIGRAAVAAGARVGRGASADGGGGGGGGNAGPRRHPRRRHRRRRRRPPAAHRHRRRRLPPEDEGRPHVQVPGDAALGVEGGRGLIESRFVTSA